MKKRKLKKRIWVVLGIFLYVCLWCLPDYEVMRSRNIRFNNYTSVYLDIAVYKAHFNSYMYRMAEDAYIQINGIPDKLVLNLYYSIPGLKTWKEPYRTVVFDYNKKIGYIVLE